MSLRKRYCALTGTFIFCAMCNAFAVGLCALPFVWLLIAPVPCAAARTEKRAGRGLNCVPPPQSAEQLAALNQFQERLARALDELPDGQRLVMLLTAMQGHSMDETAAILGVSTGTVKSRLFKARKRLMEMLR